MTISGVQSVMTPGVMLMPWWSVDNFNTQVHAHACNNVPYTKSSYY